MIDGLRLVIIDNPSRNWGNPLVRDLFHKVVGLKLKGYGKEYEQGVLPIDTTDFIGTHLTICQERGGALEPLIAYKSISLERCREYQPNLPFPVLAMTQVASAKDHEEYVRRKIEECIRTGKGLRYCSAYTIQPEVRENRILVQRLKQMLVAVQINFLRMTQTHESLLMGAMRFKVDQMFRSWGYKDIELDGRTLPPFNVKSIFDQPAMLLRLEEFNDEVLKHLETYAELWKNRIEVVPALPSVEEVSGKKAA